MTDCAVCDGRLDLWEVTVTGDWGAVERVRYGDTDYFVHGGAVSPDRLCTTWWLAPAKACGE